MLMAGYPANVLESTDNHATELFVAAFGGQHPVAAFKAWLLLGFLVFPLLVGAAAWALRFDIWVVATSTWLGCLIWALDPHAQLFREFGGFSFLLVCPLALLAASLAWRSLRSDGLAVVVAFGMAATITVWVHILGLLLVGLACLALLVVSRVTLHRVAVLAGAGTIAVASAVWWLVPLAANLRWKTDSSKLLAATGLDDFRKLLLFAPATRFQSLMVWLGLAGLVALLRTDRRLAVWLGAGSGAAFLAAFTPVGRLQAVAQIQPQRFVLTGVVWLAIPAAWFIVRAATRLSPTACWLTLTPLVACACLFQLLPWLQVAAHSSARAASLHDRTVLPRDVSALGVWLRMRSPSGRVLVEDLDDTTNLAYGGSYIGALWPLLYRVPLLGGPNELPYRQQVVDLTSGRWLGMPLASFTGTQVSERLDRYAVAWIVAVRPEPSRPLDALPGRVHRADCFGPFVTFAVRNPQGLANAALQVTLELGRVTVQGAGQRTTIVRVHWDQALRTSPSLPIERVTFPDDSVGLVRVRNGAVRNFVLASPGFLPSPAIADLNPSPH